MPQEREAASWSSSQSIIPACHCSASFLVFKTSLVFPQTNIIKILSYRQAWDSLLSTVPLGDSSPGVLDLVRLMSKPKLHTYVCLES